MVVDDGSPDNTKSVVEKYGQDTRVRYVWQPNQEANAARNKGAAVGKGQYICFLDDDDYFLENHLETLACYIQNNNYPEGMVRTGTWQKRGEQKREKTTRIL